VSAHLRCYQHRNPLAELWTGSASPIEEWDSGRVEPADQQDRLDEDAKRRRRMAERLATELAHAPGGRHGTGSDYVASRAVQVRLSSAVEARAAMKEAPTVVSVGRPEDVGQVSGSGGVVMYVHGGYFDDWSIVFPVVPFTGVILVCADKDHEIGRAHV